MNALISFFRSDDLGMIALVVMVGVFGPNLMVWRLPQAAPSLSQQAAEPGYASRPFGLQSTIAGGR